ncbi:MAG: hypothetical protein SNF68_01515 [Rikenellaceae bacterium]
MIKRVLTYIVAIVAIVGCFKNEAYDSTLVIIPAQQSASGEEFEYLSSCVVYAFAADTTNYTPQSYDEALAGIITNKENGERLSPIAVGEKYSSYYSYKYEIEEEDDDDDDDEEVVYPYEDGEIVTTLIEGLSMQIMMQNIMLVAVDTQNEGYAYCNYELGMNLAITYITVSFRPWKTAPFEQGDWMYVVPIVETEEESTEEETEVEE